MSVGISLRAFTWSERTSESGRSNSQTTPPSPTSFTVSAMTLGRPGQVARLDRAGRRRFDVDPQGAVRLHEAGRGERADELDGVVDRDDEVALAGGERRRVR